MRGIPVTLPQLGLIAITRGALGAGVGLLLSERLAARHRTTVGLALVAVGLVTTIPIAFGVFRKRTNHHDRAAPAPEHPAAAHDPISAGL